MVIRDVTVVYCITCTLGTSLGHGEARAKMTVYARYGRFVVVNHAIEEIRWCFVCVPLMSLLK